MAWSAGIDVVLVLAVAVLIVIGARTPGRR